MAISTAVDISAVARVVGIKTTFKDLRGNSVLFLPQRIMIVGQGAASVTYPSTKRQVTSAAEVGSTYGYGSPVHLAAMQLLPVNGDGVGTIPVTVYPLQEGGSAAAAAGDITPTGTATAASAHRVVVNNILSEEFVIEIGDTPTTIAPKMTAAINAVLEIPVVATTSTGVTDVESKWKGASANDLVLSVTNSDKAVGVTFAFTQPTGGLVNPDVDDALNQVGNVWETMVVNCLDIADTVSLGKYSTFGEGRWGALVRKPLVVFTGNTETTVAAATAVSDARKTDRTNAQLVSPGSNDLPFVVAARQVARLAPIANNNPPQDYGGQQATGLTPGADGDQWTYADRDSAVKKGSSTVEVKDGVVEVSDVVTFYHPTGDPTPAYRFVVDIVKIQNIIFNLDLIFATDEWNGAPLIPDNQPTINRTAKKPRMAVAEVAALIDSLGLNAIISDPEFAKENTQAAINDQNPKRLDVLTTMKLSGNTNIISVDFDFGFFFGTATVVA